MYLRQCFFLSVPLGIYDWWVLSVGTIRVSLDCFHLPTLAWTICLLSRSTIAVSRLPWSQPHVSLSRTLHSGATNHSTHPMWSRTSPQLSCSEHIHSRTSSYHRPSSWETNRPAWVDPWSAWRMLPWPPNVNSSLLIRLGSCLNWSGRGRWLASQLFQGIAGLSLSCKLG